MSEIKNKQVVTETSVKSENIYYLPKSKPKVFKNREKKTNFFHDETIFKIQLIFSRSKCSTFFLNNYFYQKNVLKFFVLIKKKKLSKKIPLFKCPSKSRNVCE